MARNTRKIARPAEQQDRIAGERDVPRHDRPAEPVVERRHDQQAEEAERGGRHDAPLGRLFLGGRAAAHPARQQRPVVLHQIERDRERGRRAGCRRAAPRRHG
ncbi:MAG: hypothetical protein WDO24_23235 [Pseudomonadota bacterium]